MFGVDCLGHNIEREQMKSEVSKIGSVGDYPKPRSKTVMRSYLGHVGYYHKFIPNYLRLSASLSNLTKKNLKVLNWTVERDWVFMQLKKATL
uniref:Reverse transcriptase/retrotransposon-derived protein RNase H-like domain-containing protein n=1 Tax=Amphimedon queenslandica TaxID=400682 RepID=A0A1X7SI83_AMPQE